MPFFNVTGSYNDSYFGTVTLVIPQGQMLSGTVTLLLTASVAGLLSGSLWNDGVSSNVSGSLQGPSSGSAIFSASFATPIGGPFTSSFTAPYSGSLNISLPENYVLFGDVTIPFSGTLTALTSGTIYFPQNGTTATGSYGVSAFSSSINVNPQTIAGLTTVQYTTDDNRQRKTYSGYRQRPRPLKFFVK